MKANMNPIFSNYRQFATSSFNDFNFRGNKTNRSTVLFLTSYPPRECGIATYSQDLIFALNNKFGKALHLSIAALDTRHHQHHYSAEVDYILETDNQKSYQQLTQDINDNKDIQIVVIQHEFGLFKTNEADFMSFIKSLNKPVIMVFHTVLPSPNEALKTMLHEFNKVVAAFIVMTHAASKLLIADYLFDPKKITVIPHGTHLVEHSNKDVLKEKYGLSGKKIISTFGLLSSGKCIETSINALKTIVKAEPNVLFLVIGKTHPTVVKNEGESYRESLQATIADLKLENNVKFINQYLPLNELLDYLQLTDINFFYF